MEKETPEERRERMRLEEIRRNPGGNLHDASNRNETGGLAYLVGGLGWKVTGILLLVLIVGYVLFSLFLR